MNYIVFDLEMTMWGRGSKRPQEIIDIGAVKVNEKLEIVDTFQSYVRPLMMPVITSFCTKFTGIFQDDIDDADGFPKVMKRFFRWIGEEPYMLVGWSNNDKKSFNREYARHNINKRIKEVLDLQKRYNKSVDSKADIGLKKALEQLEIEINDRMHSAINDAMYTTQILQRIYPYVANITNETLARWDTEERELKKQKELTKAEQEANRIKRAAQRRLRNRVNRLIKKYGLNYVDILVNQYHTPIELIPQLKVG